MFGDSQRLFLYQYAREFTQSELYRRLTDAAYVWIRFELPRPPTQQAISYIWRNRLSLADRRTIKATAHAIREVASDHDSMSDGESRLDHETVDNTEITNDPIMNELETNPLIRRIIMDDEVDQLRAQYADGELGSGTRTQGRGRADR